MKMISKYLIRQRRRLEIEGYDKKLYVSFNSYSAQTWRLFLLVLIPFSFKVSPTPFSSLSPNLYSPTNPARYLAIPPSCKLEARNREGISKFISDKVNVRSTSSLLIVSSTDSKKFSCNACLDFNFP